MNRLPLDDLTLAIARIQGLLLTAEKVDRAVTMLARAISDSMPGAPGTGVSLMDAQGRRTSSGFTDELVKQADAAQYELGEGPCISAWAGETVVLVEDVRSDPRWPRWRDAVAALPIRSVVSAPLLADREAIGALKIYSAHPGQYDEATGENLLRFAGAAATLLAHIQGTEAPLKMTDSLKAALASRDTISLACGVLMERQGITHDQALKQLVRNARADGTSLLAVSEELIAGVPPRER